MSYQSCHRNLGRLTHEMDVARRLLLRYGSPCADAVKEMHCSVDMPITECSSMLRCMWRDMQVEQLKSENDRLRQELAIREESEQEKTIEYLRQENVDWENRYRALVNENAGLRGLVHDALCATNHDPRSMFWEYFEPYSFWENFHMRARKLGIEVNSDVDS